MGTLRKLGWLTVGLMSILLAGCASNEVVDVDQDVSAASQISAELPETVKRVAEPYVKGSQLVIPSESGPGEAMLQGRFFFDFDQAIVKRLGHEELNKHAAAMKQNPSLRVRLEGHADQRGTREYNLALGERRANSVRAYLVAQGVSSSQMEVISYGEEKPYATGSTELSWSYNRRVELVYR